MRTARYLVICLVLAVIGLSSLAEGAKGTAGVNFGFPLSANSLHISITSTGGWALLGVFGALGAVVFFILALIASLRRRGVATTGEENDGRESRGAATIR